MHSYTSLKLFVSVLRPRAIHLDALATAGALVTCAAVVLNVGQLAKAPKIHNLPDNAFREPAAFTEQVTSISSSELNARIQADRPQSAMETASVSEPIRTWLEPPPISAVEVSASASEFARPKEGDGETQANVPRQDLGTADPAAPSQGEHPNADLLKRPSIVGVWAPDSGTCSARNFRDGVLPTVINVDGAWAGETFCIFRNKKQTETGWRVVARCSNPNEHWTANVRLTVNDNRLTWRSKRGTQAYTRCASNVLMAQAR